MRHKVIAQNVANANTPGFRAQEVAFEEHLLRSLREPGPGAEDVHPEVRWVEGLVPRMDGNNVDIDREVAELNKNALKYETYTQLLATKLSMMRSAITGR